MPPPKRRRRPSRLLVAALVAVSGAALALTGREAWRHETEDPIRDPAAPPATLIVPPGASADWIAQRLSALGFVRHPLVFRAFVYGRGVGQRLRAGEYEFDSTLSLSTLVGKLVRGDVVRHEITFPEGKNLAEAAEIAAAKKIDGAAFLAAALDPSLIRDLDPKAKDLEGYLFPDTYDLPRSGNAEALLVARMVGRFRSVIGPELPRIAAAKLTVRDVVILASIVELETARGDERPRIAAVFLNRLAKGMLLQTDPTVIYALKKKGTWDGNIRHNDLGLDSPFNTYRMAGLPPGPIASPGRLALLAVLQPAPVKDLYFVSRNDGSHQFSETLAEHNRAVDIYQKRRAPRRES
jgi:peptidoglycan lytic transglycosylase G